MKKTMLTAMLLFTFVCVAFGQITFPWTEDFEGATFPPENWTKIVQTGNDITQSSSQNHTADGLYSARFSSFSSSSDYNQYFFSPSLTVDASYTQLSFWHIKYNTSSELLEWGIAAGTDPASYTWSPVTLSDAAWQETVVDLTPYIGQTINIGFHYYGNYLYYVYLDDVSIYAPPTFPEFSIDPTNWNFTDVDLNTTASTTFTVSNTGVGSLGITSVAETSGDMDYFEITNNTYADPLGPGDSFTFDVEFTPTQTINYSVTVTITDDQSKDTHDVVITGNGYEIPAGSTCDNPYPVTLPLEDFTGDTALYGDDYSSTWVTPSSYYLGGDDMVLQFNLAEASTLEGTLTALTGSWIGMIVVDTCPDPDTPAPVLAIATSSGSEASLDPVVLPAGDYFLLISTWPSPQSFQFSLDLTATPLPTEPEFSIEPTEWDFGTIEINQTDTHTFTVANTGQGSLGITSIEFSAGDTDYFTIENNTYTVPLGFQESFTFDVVITPAVAGDFSATLTVTDDQTKIAHDVLVAGSCFDPTMYPPYMTDFGTDGDAFPPQDWTMYNGLLEDPIELSEGSSYWNQDDWCNVVEDPSNESARMNIYGTTRKGWLVTPPIDLGAAKTDYALEFDIALTDFYYAAPPDDPNGYSGVDDKFAVVISTDGGQTWSTTNILGMWDNDPDTDSFVYNDIPYTGEHITLPLTGFSGIVKIAFYGESTVSNADNDFFVDNVEVNEFQEPPTPVVMSSFTATVTAENEVSLSWVTESESQMMGFQVYRANSNDQSISTLVTDALIPATNTSTTHTYTSVDSRVEIGTTYYYWLETVGYSASEYYGPVSVTVEGNVPPVMPETTSVNSAYPNPFRSATNIEVGLKKGESGTVTIYNVHGQVVKSFAVTQGYHTLNWDGRDANNNACASGIYFYKLSTPSFNKTMKMMLIK